MLKLIQDNDNYKPHAKQFSNLLMFTQVMRKQESVTNRDRQTDGRTAAITISLTAIAGGINMCCNWQPVFFPTFV